MSILSIFNIMSRRMQSARRERGETSGKIGDAFAESGKRDLTFGELKEFTGRSKKALSGALKELEKLGSVLKIGGGDSYYVNVDLKLDQNISDLEIEYERKYHDFARDIGSSKATIHEANKVGLDLIKGRINGWKRKQLRPVSSSEIDSLKKRYYKKLHENYNDLTNDIEDWFMDQNTPDWQICKNCRDCKKIDHLGKKMCQCTKSWRTGPRPIMDLDDSCSNFQISIVQEYNTRELIRKI